ncbi:hypothetical protein CTEN210_16031 [Chaetoceros tenuissimus]|uniref:Uncharacterized protein n=1 Tax=Chaetoceros tenuissimus TaxID=426638 RepID=A0AAD3HDG2_9STRA|nr:hypothetical protein CTEN210_16031 [Chaetoceros tenuissimus]
MFIKDLQQEPVCLGCKLGKSCLLQSKKGNITEKATKPGDLIHADQAGSSQDRHPMTYSGHNCSEKKNATKKFHFCGAGMHSQNGVAEYHVGIIVKKARAMLLHASTHWKDEIDIELWTFAVNYAVFVWNHTPREDLGFKSPEEAFSGVQLSKNQSRKILQQLHTWGCPVYVLDDKIQEGKKPKQWEPRTCTGIFLGHSSEHSTSVSLILNPKTDRISPQYHTIFDDYFHTLQVKTDQEKVLIWDGAYSNTIQLVDLKVPTKIDFEDYKTENKMDNDFFTGNFTKGSREKRKRVSWKDEQQSPSTIQSQNSEDNEEDPDLSNAKETTAVKPSTCKLTPVKSKKRRYRSKIYKVDSTKPRPGAGERKNSRSKKGRRQPK